MATFPLQLEGILPLAQTQDQIEFWKRMRPVNLPAATDTYKRTMACSGDVFTKEASYTLAARRPLNEEGAGNRLVMAGLERFLYPWFGLPVTEKEVRKAEGRFRFASEIKKFPTRAWDDVLRNNGYMPLDVWGLPGGQTFHIDKSKNCYVPILSVEGPGALGSHLEPHATKLFRPIIAATKAKLMQQEVGEKFAEFGYRSGTNDADHAAVMMALKVGGGFNYTSNDELVCLFPDDFTSIGTYGHEYMEAYQRSGLSMEEAQEMSGRDFIEANQKSALLPDLIHTVNSGLPLILKLIKEYATKDPTKVILPRFDSDDLDAQTVIWKKMMLDAGFKSAPSIVENEITPATARRIRANYAAHGFDPAELIFGAGGYFVNGNTRDAISMAYKRTSTLYDGVHEGSIKFSDDSGKFFPPGPMRVYAQGRTLVVAFKDEFIDGEPLFKHLVKNGRINYFETLKEQNARANKTWDAYDRVEYSPKMQEVIAMRTEERNRIRDRYVTLV